MEKRYVCPDCGWSAVLEGEEWELTYNRPVLTCRNCQKEFLRKECKEIAISKVSFDDKLPVTLWLFIPLVVGVIGLLTCVHFGGAVTIFRPKNAIFGLGGFAVFFYGVFSGIKNFKKKRTYLKEEKRRSHVRCADAEYVKKLQNLGYTEK